MVHILDRPERRARVESESSAAAPTEAALAATSDLDCRSTAEILAAIHAEDRARSMPSAPCCPRWRARPTRSPTYWPAAGAGSTSARAPAAVWVVLDAAEIPPTFGFAHDRIEGLIAGGPGPR